MGLSAPTVADMARRCLLMVVVAWLGPAGVVAADEPSPASVYHVDLTIDLPITAAGFLAALVPYSLQYHLISQSCPCDPRSVNAFDRGVIGNDSHAAGQASNLTAGLAVAVPLLADGLVLGLGRPLFEDVTVFAEALGVSSGLVTLVKFIVQRPIPATYDPAPDSLVHTPYGYRSFYSGHASLTFAALSTASMTIGLRYHTWVLPWVATVLIGGSVAAERVAAGRHFYTDVIVGSAAGTAVGATVSWLHRRPAHTVALLPLLEPGAGGVMVMGTF